MRRELTVGVMTPGTVRYRLDCVEHLLHQLRRLMENNFVVKLWHESFLCVDYWRRLSDGSIWICDYRCVGWWRLEELQDVIERNRPEMEEQINLAPIFIVKLLLTCRLLDHGNKSWSPLRTLPIRFQPLHTEALLWFCLDFRSSREVWSEFSSHKFAYLHCWKASQRRSIDVCVHPPPSSSQMLAIRCHKQSASLQWRPRIEIIFSDFNFDYCLCWQTFSP